MPGLFIITKQFKVSIDTASQFMVGLLAFWTGFATFFTASGASVWGKRPFFVISTAILLITCAWGYFATVRLFLPGNLDRTLIRGVICFLSGDEGSAGHCICSSGDPRHVDSLGSFLCSPAREAPCDMDGMSRATNFPALLIQPAVDACKRIPWGVSEFSAQSYRCSHFQTNHLRGYH